MPSFLPGVELSRAFYLEVVGPLLAPWRHAAARIGWGSDVLGFDTERSTDHGWGPQLLVLVDDADLEAVRAAIDAGLPETFRGWPVRYGWDAVPVSHHVTVSTIRKWSVQHFGVDATGELGTADWLALPQQLLLEATAGDVFHDDAGDLSNLRARLDWYPDEVWLWMIGCQWHRIAQEEAFVGRTAEVGDELGSRLVAARLARELMRLWFLLSRTYWPYSKWFGSGFRKLAGTEAVVAALEEALVATSFANREPPLVRAYELTAERHNQLGITPPLDPAVRAFYGRPFRVLFADRFADACQEQVADPVLRGLARFGSIDQVADSTDLLSTGLQARQLVPLYQRRDAKDPGL